jgi:Putative auto-transporter adhesin, head GIN domain
MEPIMPWKIMSVFASGLLLAACAITTGSGHTASESRNASGFTKIELTGSGEVTVKQSGEESLTVEADTKLLPRVTSEVSNGTLVLGLKRNTISLATKTIRYQVGVRDLAGLSVSGSGDVTVTQLNTAKLRIEISGSGRITTSGSAGAQEVAISGSGSYRGADLASKTARVDITGSGAAELKVSDTLDVRISGSGSVTYSGDPQVTQRVTGSGTLTKR